MGTFADGDKSVKTMLLLPQRLRRGREVGECLRAPRMQDWMARTTPGWRKSRKRGVLTAGQSNQHVTCIKLHGIKRALEYPRDKAASSLLCRLHPGKILVTRYSRGSQPVGCDPFVARVA